MVAKKSRQHSPFSILLRCTKSLKPKRVIDREKREGRWQRAEAATTGAHLRALVHSCEEPGRQNTKSQEKHSNTARPGVPSAYLRTAMTGVRGKKTEAVESRGGWWEGHNWILLYVL